MGAQRVLSFKCVSVRACAAAVFVHPPVCTLPVCLSKRACVDNLYHKRMQTVYDCFKHVTPLSCIAHLLVENMDVVSVI